MSGTALIEITKSYQYADVLVEDAKYDPQNQQVQLQLNGEISNLMNATKTGSFNVYGNDYNTVDGSAIRDYIHVNEICESIRKAIEDPSSEIENLGTGTGYTVKQMVETLMVVVQVILIILTKSMRMLKTLILNTQLRKNHGD